VAPGFKTRVGANFKPRCENPFKKTALSHLVNSLHDGGVQVVALPEERVEGDLADLRPHRRLRQLRDGELGVLNAVTGVDLMNQFRPKFTDNNLSGQK
jgi:hypothetical protein